jgi:hypothetical protein
MAITVQMRTEISQLYVALFGRAPDSEGLGFWVGLRDAGQSLTQIANSMYATAPARAYFPLFLTNQEIIASFYVNVLGRTADAEGLAFWTAKLNAAGATPGSVITQMIDVVAHYAGTDPAGLTSQALFNNKVEVAQYYGEHGGNIDDSTIVLTSITADHATVVAAEAAITAGTIGQNGIEVSLTASQDTVAGTTANDIVHGLFGSATGDTFTAGDTVDLAGGTVDQLNLVATGTTASPAIVVKNTEIINIQDTVGATFNALLVENAPAINFANTLATQTSTVINGALASTFGLAGAGNLTVDFANTTGTADVAKVSLNGAGTSTAARSVVNVSDGSTVESVTMATAGTNFVALNAGAATKVTVTGSGTNNIGIASIGTTATIDASASTGTNTFALGTTLSNGDVVKGGTGADTAAFNATTALGVVTFTGVETLKADIDADVTLALGTSTGVKTLTLDGGTASLSVTNATSELTAVNITSQDSASPDDFSLAYATGQSGTVALTLGTTASTAAAITMDDITFTRAGSVTVNAIGTKAIAFDLLNLDKTTTALAVNVAAAGSLSINGETNVGTTSSSLTSVSLSAADDGYLHSYYINASGGSAGANGTTVNATAGASGTVDIDYIYADSFGDITLNGGVNSLVSAGSVYATSGGFGNVNVTLGSGASGYLDAYTDSSDSGVEGNIGNFSVTLASGATGSFYGYAYSGDIGNVSLDVGANTSGYVYVSAASYSAADGSYAGGGNVGDVNVNVHGVSGSGYIYVSANDNYSGDGGKIGDVTVNINGDAASGDINLYASGFAGEIGNVSIAVGASGYAYVSADAYEDSSNTDAGNIGNVGIVLGDGAYISAYFDASGSVGNVAVTGGDNVSAYIEADGYSGDVGTATITLSSGAYFSGYFSAGSGSVGAASVTVGEDSYVSIDVQGKADTGSITVVAGAGTDVNAYSYADTGHAGAVTITGGTAGDTAYVYASGGSIDAINLGGWLGDYNVDAGSVVQGTVITVGADGGTVSGTQGGDVIIGGAGADALNGNDGADVINGGGGVDTINGGNGADAIDGGAGGDTLNGDAGADAILGGAGIDTINGGSEADTINGGTGIDQMTGGTEADTFVFTGDNLVTAAAFTGFVATDVIADFVTATDKLDFTTAGSATNYSETLVAAADVAALMTAADAALNGTVKYYFGVVGTDGYLVYSETGSTALAAVKLTGVVDIAYTDIV